MRNLTNICLALSLVALPVAAAQIDNNLNPEVKKIIEQQKQNPIFWAHLSNEISRHYGKPNLYNITPQKITRVTAPRTTAPAPKLMSLQEYVKESLRNYKPVFPLPHTYSQEHLDSTFFMSNRFPEGYR